ncbi:MAG: DNA-binding response OmpR family regulator [Sulfurimonas sp.]
MARILLVEDDQILSETLLELLENYGYELTLVKTANETLDATYSNEFELMLMLLDVNIPD